MASPIEADGVTRAWLTHAMAQAEYVVSKWQAGSVQGSVSCGAGASGHVSHTLTQT